MKSFIYLLVILGACFGGYRYYVINYLPPETIMANIGDDFKLVKGQTVIIRGESLEITAENFINSTCPPGSECIFSGTGVIFKYVSGGRKEKRGLNLKEAFGYSVEILDGDYSSFIKLKIKK